jgi:hypothetical protein
MMPCSSRVEKDLPSVIRQMRHEYSCAQIPKGKPPGAGQRVNLERRGRQGEQEIDALPGDPQSSL